MRQLAAFRQAMCAAVKAEDIRALAGQLLDKARQGDVTAIKLLFLYAIGRPTDAVDPDTLDFKEWQLYRQTPIVADDLERLPTAVPVGTACQLARIAVPLAEARFGGTVVEEFAKADAKAKRKRKGKKR